MKPKTAYQIKIAALSAKLPLINERQKDWMYKNVVGEQYFSINQFRNKYYAFCYECGHRWEQEPTLVTAICGITCPECGKKLVKKDVNRATFNDSAYCAIVTTSGEFQVIRMVFVQKQMQKKCLAKCSAHEVMQHWIDQKGRETTFSKSVRGFTMCYDDWVHGSELEIRGTSNAHNLRCNLIPYKIYPGRKVLPILKRNGFNGGFYGMAPNKLFTLILKSPAAETLLKSKQIAMLKHYKKSIHMQENWPSIRICIRNRYIIKDATIWEDYLRLLRLFRKDVSNPKYICPENLLKAHDRYVEKKKQLDRKKRLEEMKQQIEAEQVEYAQEKGRFFGIRIIDGPIVIKPLETVEEFMLEGDDLGHCVFTNEYYKKPESLVMSARVDGKPVETIELSLPSMTVIQSRGLKNKATKHHSQILNLVNKNINLITQRL